MINQLAGLSLRLEHRHSDGSWSELERTHHDAADHDPERSWANGEVFRCNTCDEQVRISTTDKKPVIGPAGTE